MRAKEKKTQKLLCKAKTKNKRSNRKRAEASKEQLADFRAINMKCASRDMLGKLAFFTGNARKQLRLRGDCSYAHSRKDVHLASLTPLTGAARA